MRNKLYVSLVVIALLCLAGWTGYARGQRTNSMRQTWEYHVDFADDSPGFLKERAERNERLINQRAAEGWELVAVTSGYFYFKRPR